MEMALDAAASFEQFVRRTRTRLRLSAATMCGEWHTADDLVQETLVIMHRHWDDIEPSARGAYARAVISHLVVQGRRSARWERELLCDVLPDLSPQSREEEVAIQLMVKDALDGLPTRQRSAVYLRYWEGLPTGAIAQTLHVPAGTVRSDLARAAVRLRGVLATGIP
jgi:RNA polymerase sigma factor (sigma-70 family)